MEADLAAMDAGNGKKTRGRLKIEIKKIEKKRNLQVTFTKRRSGLFKKAAEIVALCGSDVAIIIQSPAGNFFTFGYPSVESVLHRFESDARFTASFNNGGGDGQPLEICRNEYANAMRRLEEEKNIDKEMMMTTRKDEAAAGEAPDWWDRPIDGMELDELEGYLQSLEALRDNVQCAIDGDAQKSSEEDEMEEFAGQLEKDIESWSSTFCNSNSGSDRPADQGSSCDEDVYTSWLNDMMKTAEEDGFESWVL